MTKKLTILTLTETGFLMGLLESCKEKTFMKMAESASNLEMTLAKQKVLLTLVVQQEFLRLAVKQAVNSSVFTSTEKEKFITK